MLSTIHNDEMVDVWHRTRQAVSGTEVGKKTNMIVQYNSYMGGVDKYDQLLVYYGYSHFTKKWWKRVFFQLLDVALTSSIALSLLSVNEWLIWTSIYQLPKVLSNVVRNPIPVPPSPPPVRQSARSNPT